MDISLFILISVLLLLIGVWILRNIYLDKKDSHECPKCLPESKFDYDSDDRTPW